MIGPHADEAAARAAIVAEAMSWCGTKYHHSGDVKGVGVDCAMLLVRVFVDTGLVPSFDPRPYKPQWFLHQDRALYLEFVDRFGHRVDTPKPGDIAMYKFGKHAAHGAIIVDDESLIHAFMPTGKVTMDWRRSREHQLHGYWSVFP